MPLGPVPLGPHPLCHPQQCPGTRRAPCPLPALVCPSGPWVSAVTGQEYREPLGVPPKLPRLPQCGPLLGHTGSPSASNLASLQPDLADGSQTSLEPSPAQISAAVSNGAAACWDHRLEASWWQEAHSLGPQLRHVPRAPCQRWVLCGTHAAQPDSSVAPRARTGRWASSPAHPGWAGHRRFPAVWLRANHAPSLGLDSGPLHPPHPT